VGAKEHGVTFSRGESGRALASLATIGDLVESGRFRLPVGQAFPLAEVAQAHRVIEGGSPRGRLVLLVP
jgi:NADPH:quinone reductase-like Zn-dependent oxidoreductase